LKCSEYAIAPLNGSRTCIDCTLGFVADSDRRLCVYYPSSAIIPVASVLMVFGFIVAVVSLAAISIALFVRRKRRQQYRDDEQRRLLLEEDNQQEASNMDNDLQPLFHVDASMFKINFQELHQLKEIGTGSSGAVVFRCKWNDELCAVKLFRTSNFGSEHDFKEFEKELNLLR
jgi:hypothetical protein